MNKYIAPELEIRMYNTDIDSVVTASSPADNNNNDLFTDDEHDYIVGED